MGKIIAGLLVPHAPTLLRDEAEGRETALIAALRRAGAQLSQSGVDAVIATTTHWVALDGFSVDASPHHQTVTDYWGFPIIRYDVPGDPELAEALISAGRAAGLNVEHERHGVDHGITVPLHFLFPAADVPVVPLSVTQLPLEEAWRWGQAIAAGIAATRRRVALVVSGSFSHNLRHWMAQRDLPGGKQFDQDLIRLLQEGRGLEAATAIAPQVIQAAMPEGGLRDLFMLLGALGPGRRFELLAYEHDHGVGSVLMKRK